MSIRLPGSPRLSSALPTAGRVQKSKRSCRGTTPAERPQLAAYRTAALAGSYDEFAERAGALEGLDGGRQRVRRRDEADRRGRAKVKLMGALGVTGLGGAALGVTFADTA
ncbi:DUF1515 domain-containing protein [Sinorhizobium medicae]|nr:DUF1515 domain-containing protein [Sinorhizobium medicae]MDX0846291.1 DUF1515 domain-containing protein [Sinorhizobium medicae]